MRIGDKIAGGGGVIESSMKHSRASARTSAVRVYLPCRSAFMCVCVCARHARVHGCVRACVRKCIQPRLCERATANASNNGSARPQRRALQVTKHGVSGSSVPWNLWDRDDIRRAPHPLHSHTHTRTHALSSSLTPPIMFSHGLSPPLNPRARI